MSRNFPPVSLIGVPTDVGAGHRGARMGPDAMRIAGLGEALAARGVDVADRGNLSGPVNPWQAPQHGYRHLDEVVAWNRELMHATAAELKLGRMPIMLGGDHCLGVGAITAVAKHCRDTGKRLRVIWLDAHSDFNTSAVTPSGNIHGMPVACLCGIGPDALTRLGGDAPAMDAADIRQIGIRSVDQEEKRLIKDNAIDVYDMRYIDENGMKRTMEAALQGVDENTHLHVSFDVDFLDPGIAPGSGNHRAGRPQLSRSAAGDGNDRRHRPPVVAGYRGAQSDHRRPQSDRRTGGGPGGKPVRQVHVDARLRPN